MVLNLGFLKLYYDENDIQFVVLFNMYGLELVTNVLVIINNKIPFCTLKNAS